MSSVYEKTETEVLNISGVIVDLVNLRGIANGIKLIKKNQPLIHVSQVL